MAHITNAQAYTADFIETTVFEPVQPVQPIKKSRALSQEDVEIVAALHKIKNELDYLHNSYNQATEPLLIDSIIYEMKAAHMKYMYYLHLCKEKGIISDM